MFCKKGDESDYEKQIIDLVNAGGIKNLRIESLYFVFQIHEISSETYVDKVEQLSTC